MDHTIKRTSGDRGIFLPDLKAAAAITPGELLEFDGNGDLQAHSTANGNAIPIVALEDSLRESAAGTKQIDTDVPAGDSVRAYIPAVGEQVYMFLADGANVAKGAFLASDGAGALQAVTAAAATSQAQRHGVVFVADEALDNSAGGARARITVRRI